MAVTEDTSQRQKPPVRRLSTWIAGAAIVIAIAVVVGVFVWQAVTASGNPDPTVKGLSPAAMILSTGVLVFREGLEAILVLATVTAGMARSKRREFTRAVPVGGTAAFIATLLTWFLVVKLISNVNAPEYDIQAATGLLAIVVLLVVMNWFFHKLYWTGWIGGLNERRKQLMEATNNGVSRTFFGLMLLGFAAIYREGFEVVLFLQSLRLQAGNVIVLEGTLVGLALTMVVAALTFMGHKRLPYKKMLIITGVLLGFVLLVMVGEEVQEMQQAGWLSTTSLHVSFPDWMGVWFSLFPNVQTIVAQVVAALLVLGSYFSAQYIKLWKPRRSAT